MEFVAKSDVGKRRTNNEDSFLTKIFNDELALFIVADGLGGYASGEVASNIITETISSYIEEYINIICYQKEEKVIEIFKEAVLSANTKIYNLEKTDSKYDGMGTTVVAVLKVGKNIFYTSVGDTRMYYIDSKCKNIEQITVDDTYVNELVKTKVISKKEAENHPQKHMLTKAIGILKNINIEISKLEETNGYILLCSDGLTNMLSDKEILSIVKNNKFSLIAEKLIIKANENGGEDNITVVLIKEGE